MGLSVHLFHYSVQVKCTWESSESNCKKLKYIKIKINEKYHIKRRWADEWT